MQGDCIYSIDSIWKRKSDGKLFTLVDYNTVVVALNCAEKKEITEFYYIRQPRHDLSKPIFDDAFVSHIPLEPQR